MVASFIQTLIMAAACTGVVACSQQQAGKPESPGTRRARLCIAGGQPGRGALSDPAFWAITVSNDGGLCPHVRDWAEGFEVAPPPRHGEVTQETRNGKTIVSYRAEPGYIGSDSFGLRHPGKRVSLSYLVGVLP